MVVQIKSGKRENLKSFWDNLYRKRSTRAPYLRPHALLSRERLHLGPLSITFRATFYHIEGHLLFFTTTTRASARPSFESGGLRFWVYGERKRARERERARARERGRVTERERVEARPEERGPHLPRCSDEGLGSRALVSGIKCAHVLAWRG